MKSLLFLLALLALSGCAPQPPAPSFIPYQEVKEPEPEYESEVYRKTRLTLCHWLKTFLIPLRLQWKYKRNAIVKKALSYLGKRDGKDCSGYVTLVNNIRVVIRTF